MKTDKYLLFEASFLENIFKEVWILEGTRFTS